MKISPSKNAFLKNINTLFSFYLKQIKQTNTQVKIELTYTSDVKIDEKN
jgi:hypothetical protein